MMTKWFRFLSFFWLSISQDMEIKWFNFWYFFWIFAGIGIFFALFFILRKKSKKTQKVVLACILFGMLLLHFLKCFIPPYSTDPQRLYRDIFFINICGANIALFPFFFLTKNEKLKDYMFFMGVISGILSVLAPLEPLQNAHQTEQTLEVIRFYLHHIGLWVVPMLMVTLGLHKPKIKRILWVPTIFMAVLLFIMVNQVLQSELGFIALRGDDILNINYKNTSMIWAPANSSLSAVFTALCPSFFKTIPVGPHAGEAKYWPWFWLLVPAYVYLTILSFLICVIFFKEERLKAKAFCTNTIAKIKSWKTRKYIKDIPDEKTNKDDN